MHIYVYRQISLIQLYLFILINVCTYFIEHFYMHIDSSVILIYVIL